MKKTKVKELDQLKNQLARALADYDNLRKRTEAEKEVWVRFSAEKVLVKLLPVIDMLEGALKHTKDGGLAIAVGEFKKILNAEGLEEIKPQKDAKFDPQLHEAVESLDGGRRGNVAELVLPGWKFGDLPAQAGGKVLRPAKVKVYGEKSQKEQELEREVVRGDYV
ncbi:MAG: nucleotide exchange factor GrpE [Patescibacteria group bacterium]